MENKKCVNNTKNKFYGITIIVLAVCATILLQNPVSAACRSYDAKKDKYVENSELCLKTMPNNEQINEWNLDNVTSTEVILDRNAVAITKAAISYDEEAKDEYEIVSFDTYNVLSTVSGNNKKSIRYKTALKKSDTLYELPGEIYLKYKNAARSTSGERYDMKITIKNIKVKAGADRKKGIPIVWGSDEILKFGAFSYNGDGNGGYHGIKYTIVVQLYVSGTNFKTHIPSGNKMLWGFDDVDVPDKFADEKQYRDWSDGKITKTRHWAEHVEIPSDGYNGAFYISSDSNLSIDKNKDGTVHIYNSAKYGETGREDVLYLVDPHGFHYIWQGTDCATVAAAIAGTIYFGHSEIYSGNTLLSQNGTVTVHSNSKSIRFRHYIERNNEGPQTDNERYYVASGTYAPPAKGSATSPKSYTSERSKTEEVYTTDDKDNPKDIAISPGQSFNVWQTLYYEASNTTNVLGRNVDITCDINKTEVQGTACIKLYRPPATFTATVTANAKLNGNNFVEPSNNSNKVTTSDGSFSIQFGGKIKRVLTENDSEKDAGGTVATEFATFQSIGNASSNNMVANTRNPEGNDTISTNALSVNGTHNIFTSKNVYNGTLKYGEERTVCGVVHYRNVIDQRLSGGYSSTSAYKCVKVYRDPKPCDINTGVEFGVHNGENLGRIGAVNYSVSGNDNFSYTPNDAASYLNASDHTQRVTVWARPGDSIKFEHSGCAGAQYAINNNSSLSNVTSYNSTGRLRHYTASSWSVNPADVNVNDYLFGEKLSAKSQDSPLKYSSSKTWSSTDTGSSFLVGDNVELSEQSPSDTTNSTYARDTYNNESYSCLNLNEYAPFQSNHYQITGVNNTNDTSCHAYSKTTVASDVGHIITQRLNWNYLKVVNDSLSLSGRNTKLAAEANVMVPYNYNAQPYINNSGIGNVVYRGSNMGVNMKIFVTPRKNGAFGTGDTEQDKALNTYATITKPTTVTAQYYYRSRSNFNSIFGRTTINDAAYSGRLNQNGAFNGNAADTRSLSDGGSTVGEFSIPVPDSLEIGDKVCVSLTVTPADSHNKFMQYVAGSGDNYAAVMETGTSSKTAEFCRTVAKLPTMSVEGSNAFTGDTDPNGYGFNTSRFSKTFDNSGTSYMFGSWSEYGVYGKVTVNNNHGFASGATFGYQTGNDGNITINKARDNSGEVAKSGAAHSSTCVYSTQTFANANCSSNDVGKAGIGENAARQFRERIEDRFTSGSSPWIRESEYGNDCVTDNYYHTHKCIKAKGDHTDNAYHKYADYDVYMNNNRDAEGNYIRDENGMIHVRIDGDAYFGSATSANSTKVDMVMNHNFWSDTETSNWTYVYEIDGTFVLDGDIKVGDIRNGGNNYRDDPVMQRLGNVRVPIISVKKLHLTNRVTRIDAIILADEIDTCAYNSYADFVSGNKIKADRSNLSADVCNNTVEFRAPVYTKKLILNRTAGSESGSNTIQRAEIFDMNMATYLWSYNQMSRYSQAVTVEQREGAPRY